MVFSQSNKIQLDDNPVEKLYLELDVMSGSFQFGANY